jgi:Carbohydrate family 9 binding domain-like
MGQVADLPSAIRASAGTLIFATILRMRHTLCLLLASAAFAQPPLHYTCLRADKPIRIDGRLDDPAWQAAPWTPYFVDIEGDAKPKPRFRTRVKMLWDDTYFYVAAELEEPHVWATLTEHDSVIFRDNDFEVFLNPSGDTRNYFEFEINALNTGWDLFLPKPYREGGKADNSWEIPGLKTAVAIDGTLNKPTDRDGGWTIEIAFPWTAFASRAPVHRPAAGDEWRVNFSRVEWRPEIHDGRYVKPAGQKEDNWVWSPQGEVNMHIPARWGYVRFVADPAR